MQKTLSVTVGIPAYNEEKNIGSLLRAVLVQKQDGFSLEKIIVVSEGSTDNTNKIIKEFNDQRITLIAGNWRCGQTDAQNIIFDRATTDAVIILEADTTLASPTHFAALVNHIKLDETTGLV